MQENTTETVLTFKISQGSPDLPRKRKPSRRSKLPAYHSKYPLVSNFFSCITTVHTVLYLPPCSFFRRLKQHNARTTMARRRRPATKTITAIIQSFNGSPSSLAPGRGPAGTKKHRQTHKKSFLRTECV